MSLWLGLPQQEDSLVSCSQGWCFTSLPKVAVVFMLQSSTSLESLGSWQGLVLVLLSLELEFLSTTTDCWGYFL